MNGTDAINGMVSCRNVVPELIQSFNKLTPAQDVRIGLAIHGHLDHSILRPRLHRFQTTKNTVHQHISTDGKHTQMRGFAGIGQVQINAPQNQTKAMILPRFSQGPESDLNSPAKVAVVHQGHLENQKALHEILLQRGYPFKGETTGELIAHLMHATYQNEPAQAVHRALGLMAGNFAVGVMFMDHPDRVFAAPHGIPIYFMSDSEKIAWSSQVALLPTQQDSQVHILAEGTLMDIQLDGYKIIHPNSQINNQEG